MKYLDAQYPLIATHKQTKNIVYTSTRFLLNSGNYVKEY